MSLSTSRFEPAREQLTGPRTDFATWDRKTLEQFARQAADENKQLRADLLVVHGAWRDQVTKESRND